MKIERINIRNFKCFDAKTLELDPCFTLIAGDNGSGKTSILDALAIAAGIWLARLPDDMLVNSRRSVFEEFPDVKRALVDRFAGTATACFDSEGRPVPRQAALGV